jgi:hypothetical protein
VQELHCAYDRRPSANIVLMSAYHVVDLAGKNGHLATPLHPAASPQTHLEQCHGWLIVCAHNYRNFLVTARGTRITLLCYAELERPRTREIIQCVHKVHNLDATRQQCSSSDNWQFWFEACSSSVICGSKWVCKQCDQCITSNEGANMRNMSQSTGSYVYRNQWERKTTWNMSKPKYYLRYQGQACADHYSTT